MPITGRQCCVRGCTSADYPESGLSFHRIPRNQKLREKWQKVIQVHFTSSSYVCNRHFRPYEVFTHTRCCTLKTGVVPSIFPDLSALEKLRQKSLADDDLSLSQPAFPPPILPSDHENTDEELVIKNESAELDHDYDGANQYVISDNKTEEIEECPIIKRDSLELEHDNEDAVPASHLPSKTASEKTYEETLSIKSELESDDEFDDILPVPANNPGLSTLIIGPMTSSYLPSITASAPAPWRPPTLIIGPLPSSHLSSEPQVHLQVSAPAIARQTFPRMLIGPLPSSHLTPVATVPVSSNSQQTLALLSSQHTPSIPPTLPKPLNPVNIKNRERIMDLNRKVSVLVKRLKTRNVRIRKLKIKALKSRENPVNIAAQKKIEELTQEMATLWRRLRNRDLKIKQLNSKIQSLKRQTAKSR